MPEWRRRILHGEMEYGETKDLFSSAATGLENIFRPLPEQGSRSGAGRMAHEGHTINETTLPSSPPPYMGHRRDVSDDESDLVSEKCDRGVFTRRDANLPKVVSFRPTEVTSEEDSVDGHNDTDASAREKSANDSEIAETSNMSFRRKQLLEDSRKISGQSDIRHEDFSPIFIARHNSEDGGVLYTPMQIPANQLRKKLEILQNNRIIVDPESENGPGETATVNDRAGDFESTDDYARNGGFLNMRRGGGSAADSFHRRPSSPSMIMDFSEMLPESSLQASTPKQFRTVSTEQFASTGGAQSPPSPGSPYLPRAPHPSPEKRPQPTLIKSSSPLKLFGPYDTFTNQTLLRRISQFEEQQDHNNLSHPASEARTSSNATTHTGSRSRDQGRGSPDMRRQLKVKPGGNGLSSSLNKFGGGELDAYVFDGDVSLASSIAVHSEEKENKTPLEGRIPSMESFKFDIHEDSLSEGESLVVKRNRHREGDLSSSPQRLRMSKSLDGLHTRLATGLNGATTLLPTIGRRKASEAKRPRTSPTKDPTPKRRRTLHRSDIAYGLEDQRAVIQTVKTSHYSMQSAITRERSQTRYLHSSRRSAPSMQTTQQMIRPRSLTLQQRTPGSRERPPLAELRSDTRPKSAKTPISADNSELSSVDGSRKTSMKTQDFFDAAEEVMAMIRSKARPTAALTGVEESEGESLAQPTRDQSAMTEESFEESTQEPFSRPPSRDGQPIPRVPARQEDPELVSQLKKYEEQGDTADIMSQSLGSIRTLRTSSQPSYGTSLTSQRDYLFGQAHGAGGVVSDIPNVKISRNPEHAKVSDEASGSPRRSYSSGSSTARSIPTASSRGSDSKRLIAPDVVAELIGNQVGNMVFDDVNKMWQKIKKTRRTAVSIVPSEDSEEDPFASIPDLTVDSVKEKRHLSGSWPSSRSRQNDSFLSWPSSKGGKMGDPFMDSELFLDENGQAHAETALEDDEEIEHEISLHEDRIHKATPGRRKNLTITFSSPIASIIQDRCRGDYDGDSYEAESSSKLSFGDTTADSIQGGRHGTTGRPVSSSSRSRSRGLSVNFPEGQPFIPRPVSRIDEQDENGTSEQHVPQKKHPHVRMPVGSDIVSQQTEPMRNPDLSVVMATPNPARAAAVLATPLLGQYVGRFSLSPMSEFTVHQVDTSCALEVSYVVGDRYYVTGDGSKKTMSKAVRSLVEKITEVEPFEPDWQTVPELDLSSKHLDTLHMLDEFCTSLVTLDVSDNAISHLDGVPQGVRNLRMTNNLLSELTAWRQLTNLQYIDVSNNQIKSLSAFNELVHLRSIRADNNQITSLDGLKFHDGLQVLRVRGNQITNVDFDGTKMQRLTELDLENNEIVAFENSDQLTSLSTLNLQHNALTSFTPSKSGSSSSSIRFLKISNNNLKTLDLSVFPSLRLLHADRNAITKITGFAHCRRLDSLSLREQKGDVALDTSFLDSACEVRKLFLSGNRLSAFKPGVDFLNLQYLELANCGLQTLAPDIGQLMPNLRMLNINFNAIDDLWPLRYIPRLKKLLAAGNRLTEARKIAVSLAEFPHLSRLDLRNNGATLGFYAPVQTLVSTEDGKEAGFDPFVLPDIDVERQQNFASCLDMSTRMRKRIYDIIVLNDCRQLKMLDGLPISKDVLSARDDVWNGLVRSGIVQGDKHQANESTR